MVRWLLERTVSLEIEEAYATIKTAFTDKGCKIISEQSAKQDFVWAGITLGYIANFSEEKNTG